MMENTFSARFSNRSFSGDVRWSGAGEIELRIMAVSQNQPASGGRRAAALVYEIAAELERQSESLGSRWTITADPMNARVAIELAEAGERVPAEALLAGVVDQFDLA